MVIDILYCGVCHSDLHRARNDWGFSQYPIVPGHEIIGRVVSVGDDVRKFKAGDLVGIGCMVDSCRECSPCKQGLEQYCEEGNIQTYNGIDRHDHRPTFGGYSQSIVCSQDFVLRIPENWMLLRRCSVRALPPGRRCVAGGVKKRLQSCGYRHRAV